MLPEPVSWALKRQHSTHLRIRRIIKFSMSELSKNIRVLPDCALPGAEVEVGFDGLRYEIPGELKCIVDSTYMPRIASSSRRMIVKVRYDQTSVEKGELFVESSERRIGPAFLTIPDWLVGDMHIVANPAIDPKNGSIILTRSGGRGQQLPATLFRLEVDGFLDELPVDIPNPTGMAFDADGRLYVTNRKDGVVCRIDGDLEAVPVATGLGIATGIAFDSNGIMFVGDRTGTIYRILADGTPDEFARLEPSVAAYHMAFGPDGRLYVSAPGLASYEPIYTIDPNGEVSVYFKGFGRPQGIAFDAEGTLYIAGCYRGRRGIFSVEFGATEARHIVSGNMIVGLCFDREGNMIIATGDTVYSFALGTKGTLLR